MPVASPLEPSEIGLRGQPGHARLEVALAGNPNTGKTTLFNALTGARAHVGNYPGITVERRMGSHRTAAGEHWQLHDLPGCYSLSAHSLEEEIAHHALTGRIAGLSIDVAVVVLDATNLSRNLFLLLQVAELGKPVVGALNMMDAARAQGLDIDVEALEQALGCPIVPMVARKGVGLRELEAAVARVARAPELGRVADTIWPADVREAIDQAKAVLRSNRVVLNANASGVQDLSDGETLWWLATDPGLADAAQPGLGAQLLRAVPRGATPEQDIRRRVVQARFARIDALLDVREQQPGKTTLSDRIDRVVLHPALGAILFLVAMGLLFQAVFFGAEPAMVAVDTVMGALSDLLTRALPESLLRSVLVDGVMGGIAATLVFLPQILLLFLGIALLEDSGYLARTAFIVDRLMGRIGLPGQAFVPLLSSFACAVPGIMAARTMADPRDRLLTILIAPLMSCSARLPVYTLVTASVFAGQGPVLGFLSLGGLVVAAMYALGFLIALASAFVLRRTVVPGGGAPLLLEMPPWRWPRLRNVLRALWDRGRFFVTQTGTVIVALSVVLWALLTFPRQGLTDVERQEKTQTVQASTTAGSPERKSALAAIDSQDEQLRLERSIGGRMGKLIEPAILPLGFDWRIGIGLIGSFAAREVLVPTLGQVYGHGKADVDDAYTGAVARSMIRAGGLSPLKGVSLMVFFAIAMQCLSTVATIRRETSSWRWPIFATVYLNALAWLASFAVYQGGLALGWS